MSNYFYLVICMIFSTLTMAQKVPLTKELLPAEIQVLEQGEVIVKTRENSTSPWPEITIYTLIKATALESMGIFSALDYQKEYVPNVLKSKPVKHLSPTEVLTEYEMHVPFPLSNAHYVHGSIVHAYQEDYELTWYKVESTSTEEVKGSAYFTPYKEQTLFRYRSYIKPKSILGSLVKKIMVKDTQNTVKAIRDHIEKLKRENSKKMALYSALITRSLNGEFVYKDQIDLK